MTGYSPRRRGSILSDMADIAQDLWASVPETVPAEKPTAVRDEPTAPDAPKTAPNAEKSADSAPKVTYADEKSLPFTELWKVADEPIDWTEVLSSPIPTDGLVSAEKWAIYRQYADKVLSGDTAAYLDVPDNYPVFFYFHLQVVACGYGSADILLPDVKQCFFFFSTFLPRHCHAFLRGSDDNAVLSYLIDIMASRMILFIRGDGEGKPAF